MALAYEKIIGSSIFKFVVGPCEKEYSIHGAAISSLSKPLDALLNGNMRESLEKCVKWPDVTEETFMRFIQWAYTGDYVPQEPEHICDDSVTGSSASLSQEAAEMDGSEAYERPLYSLLSYESFDTHKGDDERCRKPSCSSYGRKNLNSSKLEQCLRCRDTYSARSCSYCYSVCSNCPRCGPSTMIHRHCCSNKYCTAYNGTRYPTEKKRLDCIRCQIRYETTCCKLCDSVLSDCPCCAANMTIAGKKANLIARFLAEDDTGPSIPTSNATPSKDTEPCEDYTGVFLCHAQLYVMGDKYDIPSLRQLAWHRLHATLKGFTLSANRLDDIATLARYVYENTCVGDKIRDMILLYYACIIEDVSKHDGLRSLIDEVPDFALDLISVMVQRLA